MMLPQIEAVKLALAPYLIWIKVGLVVLVLGLAFGAGYKYRSGTSATQIATQSKEITILAAENASLRQANAKNAEAVEEANAIVEANKKTAADKQTQGQTVGQLVDKVNSDIERIKKANLQRASIVANSEKCQELMRMNVCNAIPMP